jgi:hypothetical protein
MQTHQGVPGGCGAGWEVMRFILWCIAMIIGLFGMLAWAIPSILIVCLYGSFMQWDVYDVKELMMPYYPIQWMHERFAYKGNNP